MIGDRLQGVRQRVDRAADRAGRDPAAICLVAVSKTHPPSALRDAVAAGAVHLGENRIQEAAVKRAEVHGAVWHLIGPLQRNKVKLALDLFDLIHTVDRPSLAERMQRLLEERGAEQPQRVLVEVNVGGEEQKAGVAAIDAEDLLRCVADCQMLQVEGLMAIPPWQPVAEASRPYFAELREIRDELEQRLGFALPELSMGMSHDFEVAIEEGATIVRVGTAIFGSRA